MAETCPNCGADLPPELGQHALTPVSRLVQCPTCGENVTLTKPAEDDEAARAPDVAGETATFSGEETVEGVMDELGDKPGGPGSET
jgi:DNA-directed RNA polymerase subunit RPC12/RpoP